MQKNKLMYAIVGLVVVGLAAWAASLNRPTTPLPQGDPGVNQSSTEATTSVTTTVSSSLGNTTPSAPKTYTLADITKHKDGTSCWTSINGGVYDLTAWIAQHPGGEDKILGLCGKDGSGAFNNQHGEGKKQADTLVTFKIGTLSNQ